MRQDKRPEQLEEVLGAVQVGAELYGVEVVGDGLSLHCLLPPDHIGGDVRLYEVGGPEVAHPAQQVEGPVPHGDQRVPAEQDGLAPVGRLGELGEHDPGDAGRDEHPDDALDAHDQDGPGTPGAGHPPSVPGVTLMMKCLL